MNMKRFLILFAAAVGLLTACVNDELRESAAADKLAGVDAQVEAVMGSAEDLKALNDALAEFDADVNEASEAVAQHLAYLKDGVSLEEASLAALDLQKKIATVVGAVEGTLFSNNAYGQELKNSFETLHEGVAAWLGESFSVYYPVVLAQAKVEAVVAGLNSQLGEQQSYVNALISDVEAGLRKDENPDELVSLAGSVQKALDASETLVSGIASLASEVEKEYKSAVKAMASDPASFDGSVLAELNSAAVTKADAAQTSLVNLAAEVTQCKENLAALQDRLSLVEGAVNDLLGMIQSVTFMSQNSSDNAVAYYEMNVDKKVSDSNLAYYGKAQRTATGEMELNYIVRPAAASTVLNANIEAVSVFGYYADRISPMSVSPSNYIDLEVTKVVATDANRGLVTVTVKPNLKEAFYFKEVGAKCALSIKTGVTDITSRFVEIVPMDNSTKVYVTSITPSEKSVTLDKGKTMTLEATVAPSNASEKAYSWKSSNEKIVKINSSTGLLEAVGVGETTVIATTHGVDEWGLPLTAECKVKVNEAFRLSGPPYVEQGYEAQLFLDYPSDAIVESKVWSSSENSKLTVDENGKVKGLVNTYNSNTKQYNGVTVSCTINGVVTVNWEMKVAAPQPKSIKTPTLQDNQNEVTMRVDESYSLASTIYPENLPEGAYRIMYSSDQGLGWISDAGVINAYKITMSPTTAWVYLKVENYDQEKYYISDSRVQRTVIVKVLPYYVKTISLDDIEMQLGQSVTLSPRITADVDGKTPTNAVLTWKSDNENIATVDQNGVVTSHGTGIVNITATSTDGTNISGTCKINITQPWKSFEIGDYVVRTSNGDIDFAADYNTAQGKGTVVGVVIAKTNPRASDPMLPASCTHGVAVGLGEGEGKWWSGDPASSPYKVYEWALQNGYQSLMGVDWTSARGTFRSGTAEQFVGYNNTLALQAYISAKGLSSDIINALKSYRSNSKTPALPSGASEYYLPSVAEMDAIAAYSNGGFTLSNKLKEAGGVGLTNMLYWTVSENGNSYSQAAVINPLTGALDVRGKTTAADGYSRNCRTRYVFAF